MVGVGGAHPLPGAYEPVRIPETVQEDDSEGLARTFERVALPILIISALLTISLVGSIISDPPEFHTDLADFAPDGPSKEAQIGQRHPSATNPRSSSSISLRRMEGTS